eukprot:21222-Heterococcus_DN1.PRE.4
MQECSLEPWLITVADNVTAVVHCNCAASTTHTHRKRCKQQSTATQCCSAGSCRMVETPVPPQDCTI